MKTRKCHTDAVKSFSFSGVRPRADARALTHLGARGIDRAASPHDGTARHAGSTPAASTNESRPMDASTDAALDQAAAHLRDAFDELGVSVHNPEHVRVLEAMIVLFASGSNVAEAQPIDLRWYALLFSRYLGVQ